MEIVHNTRRHPEMEKYVEITPCVCEGHPDAQIVRLKIDHQSFTINDVSEDMRHAEWMRDQLCTALARLVSQHR